MHVLPCELQTRYLLKTIFLKCKSKAQLIFVSIEGVCGKSQVTSDKLQDSASNCLLFTLETQGEFDVLSRIT